MKACNRIVAILMAILILMAFAACGKDTTSSHHGTAAEGPTSTGVETVEEYVPEDDIMVTVGDKDFHLGAIQDDNGNLVVTEPVENETGLVVCQSTYEYADNKLTAIRMDYYLPDAETAEVFRMELEADSTVEPGSVTIDGCTVTSFLNKDAVEIFGAVERDVIFESLYASVEDTIEEFKAVQTEG